MRKKLRENAGLTVVEMLAATAVLMLLALMLSTGLQMVMNSYQTVIAQSEVDLLVSTAVDALADELRYARDVKERAGSDLNCDFTYTSDSFFGEGVYLDLEGGRIVACKDGSSSLSVLSTGAYGSGGNKSYREYQVTAMTIKYKPADNTFEIYLKAETDGLSGPKISADTSVTVRCLNPQKETTPAGGA